MLQIFAVNPYKRIRNSVSYKTVSFNFPNSHGICVGYHFSPRDIKIINFREFTSNSSTKDSLGRLIIGQLPVEMQPKANGACAFPTGSSFFIEGEYLKLHVKASDNDLVTKQSVYETIVYF